MLRRPSYSLALNCTFWLLWSVDLVLHAGTGCGFLYDGPFTWRGCWDFSIAYTYIALGNAAALGLSAFLAALGLRFGRWLLLLSASTYVGRVLYRDLPRLLGDGEQSGEVADFILISFLISVLVWTVWVLFGARVCRSDGRCRVRHTVELGVGVIAVGLATVAAFPRLYNERSCESSEPASAAESAVLKDARTRKAADCEAPDTQCQFLIHERPDGSLQVGLDFVGNDLFFGCVREGSDSELLIYDAEGKFVRTEGAPW